MLARLFALSVIASLLLAGCTSGSTQSQTPSGTANCTGVAATKEHQAPELEAKLPANVAGRNMARWSLRDRCVVEFIAGNAPGGVDAFIAKFDSPGDSRSINLGNVAYAVAGRSDTAVDPPYFVLAAARPDDEDEIRLNLVLLLGSMRFHDVEAAAYLEGFEPVTIAGKEAYRGTADLLDQDEHQRGRPYLYETDDTMFLVIAEDAGWTEDVFEQLPS